MKVKILKQSDSNFLKVGEVYNAEYFGDERIICIQEDETKKDEISPNDVFILSAWEHNWFEFV